MNNTATRLAMFLAVPAIILVGAAIVFVSGAPSSGRRPATVPVAGRIIVDGVPAFDAHIAFHPVDPAINWRPVTRSGPDGSFRLMTFKPGDGAPPGDYVVTLLWIDSSQPYDECGDMSQHDRLRGAYGDINRSPLHVTVTPGMSEVMLFASAPGGWTSQRARDQAAQK